jgi:hypothetical protein
MTYKGGKETRVNSHTLSDQHAPANGRARGWQMARRLSIRRRPAETLFIRHAQVGQLSAGDFIFGY